MWGRFSTNSKCVKLFAAVALVLALEFAVVSANRHVSSDNFSLRQKNEAYSEEMAKWLSVYAATTYCPIDKVADFTCAPCQILKADSFDLLHYKMVEIFGHAITGFLGISESRRAIIVAYEGTNSSFAQIWQEARFSQLVNYNRTRLIPELDKHLSQGSNYNSSAVLLSTYFFEAFRALNFSGIITSMQRNSTLLKNFRVFITGHSLGGAISTIAALDYSIASKLVYPSVKLNPPVLYTFGAPRVGNSELGKALDFFNVKPYRIVNKSDLVPHVPPCKSKSVIPGSGECDGSVIDAPYHVPTEIWYPNGYSLEPSAVNEVKVCEKAPLGEDEQCSNSRRPLYNIFDHFEYMGIKISALC